MELWIKIFVCFLAGAGAGLGTGFAGMSAAAVITPMLVTFLKMDHFTATGIALASDVLASAVSAFTYGRNKNIDVKNSMVLMIIVLTLTVVGSFVAEYIPNTTMGNFSVLMTVFLGLKFLIWPVTTTKENMQQVSKRRRLLGAIFGGIYIGFVCGFIGAGGGMMMLLVLTMVMGYDLKTAVGTSVLIMTFTALDGAVAHFSLGGSPDWLILILCVVFTFIWARIAAVIANKAKPITLNRVTGIILTVLGVAILVVKFLPMLK